MDNQLRDTLHKETTKKTPKPHRHLHTFKMAPLKARNDKVPKTKLHNDKFSKAKISNQKG